MLFAGVLGSVGNVFDFKLTNPESFESKEHTIGKLQFFLKSHRQQQFRFYYLDEQRSALTYVLLGTIYSFGEGNQDEKLGRFAEMYTLNKQHAIAALDGDFVLFIYDTKSHALEIIRDQLGIVPFCYCQTASGFFFCSDELTLAKNLFPFQSLNPSYLLKNFTDVSFYETMHPEIGKLAAGNYLSVKNGLMKETRYWFPENLRVNKKLSVQQMRSELTALLEEAVRVRCDQKYQAASHLSGGIDSALVTALVRKKYAEQKSFYAFSWSPDFRMDYDVDGDERKVICSLAEKVKVTPQFIDTEKVNGRIETPIHLATMSSYKEDLCLDFCEQNKIGLIFTGWGGDEFLSIKDNGTELDLLKKFRLIPLLKRYDFHVKKWLKHLVKDLLFPYLGWIRKIDLQKYQYDSRYLKSRFIYQDPLFLKCLYTYRSRRDIHLNYLKMGHLQERTEYFYNLGAIKGVCYKYPLLDKKVVEYILQIPSTLIYHPKVRRNLIHEISSAFLPGDFLENYSKRDPALQDFEEQLVKEQALKYQSKLPDYKKDSLFQFIDFEKIEAEIIDFKQDNNKNKDLSDVYLFIYLMENLSKFRAEYTN